MSRQVETYVAHVLDIFKELEAENYTMRIAAKRSFWKYKLEGPNPEFWMVYEGVGVRSAEVDWSRESVWGFLLVVLMDLEAEVLSELKYFYALSIYIGFGSRFY